MKQSKLRKFCIGVASSLPIGFHGTESLLSLAKRIEDYILGYTRDAPVSGCAESTHKAEKATLEEFQKVFHEKVFGGDSLTSLTEQYKLYLDNKWIYDVDHWIEITMRHQSSLSGELYLRPIIKDRSVKETYTAEVQDTNEEVSEASVVVSLFASPQNTEIIITHSELRLLLQATEYFVHSKD